MEAPKRFLRDESGLETVEWALSLGLVILLTVSALIGVRGHMIAIFKDMTRQLSTALSEATGISSVVARINMQANTLNQQSMGKWITAYIQLPDGYDVGDIVVSSVVLNGQVSAQKAPTQIGDHNSDGVADLMVKFDRSAVQRVAEFGDGVALTVTGRLSDGTHFEGSDTIIAIEEGT